MIFGGRKAMSALDALLSLETATLMLVFMRVLGLILFAPIFSSPVMPLSFRFYLVIAVTLLLSVSVRPPAEFPTTMISLATIMLSELLIGLVLGTFTQLIFVALQIAGQTAGTQLGLSLASVVNPQFDEQNSTTAVVYATVASLAFFGTGLDRELFRVVFDTFEVMPLGQVAAHASVFDFALGVLQQGMILSVRIAAPVTVALFLAELSMGFVGRTVPQLNVLSIGFSVRIVLGLLVTAVGLSDLGTLFLSYVGEAIVESTRALALMIPD
jgi:flagellar biosynthetic protein FliR